MSWLNCVHEKKTAFEKHRDVSLDSAQLDPYRSSCLRLVAVLSSIVCFQRREPPYLASSPSIVAGLWSSLYLLLSASQPCLQDIPFLRPTVNLNIAVACDDVHKFRDCVKKWERVLCGAQGHSGKHPTAVPFC